MSEKVLIGTSGWSYDDWVGPFYPQGLEKKDWLSYYSKIFYTNEINSTFYTIPSRWIVEGWVNRTPEDFIFSAKIPQVITHETKLDIDECYEELKIYLDVMNPLISAGKLLAFLIQLPPYFNKKDHFENLMNFVDNWPGDYKKEDYCLVVEFRHKSWMEEEVFEYLKDKELSYCAVIEPKLPPRMDLTNEKLAYIRFHGFGKKIWFDYLFDEEQISEYAKSVRNVIANAEKVGIYFNNHFSGYAVKNSFMMMKELEMKPRNKPEKINLLEIKKKSGSISKDQTSLDKFI